MADVNVEFIGGCWCDTRGRKFVAHHLAIFATAGAELASSARWIDRRRGEQLHRKRVVNYRVRPIAACRETAAFGCLVCAHRIPAWRVIVSVQGGHDWRHVRV